MGSERFQSEYIEYLQNRNAELLTKLAKMKEIYENKIFSKDLNQHYFISTLVDVLNVCTLIPEEIDTLFDKMSEAMSVLINILSRKSTLIQLGEKISKILNPSENKDMIDVQSAVENNNSKTSRKTGMVKVSPMVDGHVISTEPRICLSRMSGDYIPNRSDGHCLSPILEVSSDVTLDSSNVNNHNFKELQVTAERLNLNQATYNYINEESPKGRFKVTEIWKKSLSTNRQTQNKKDTNFSQNSENTQKLDGETGQPQSSENDTDPLEGPSWLFNEDCVPKSSPKCFVDFRRRRHRYARKFDKDKDDVSYFRNEVLNTENMLENMSDGNHCDNRAEDLNWESSESLIDSDEEFTLRSKKQDQIRKRRECNNRETSYCSKVQKRSSRRFTNKREKKNSDASDSSYEGDNEEYYPGKCKKSSRKSYRKNRSKSIFESESAKSPKEPTGELDRFDSQENQSSNNECLKPLTYDINFLIRDALGKEAHISIEDCMKKNEKSKKRGESGSRSNGFRSKSKTKSPTMSLSNDKKMSVIDGDRSLTNQSQRSKRKAAPINLTEPKLHTKLRRS